MRAKTYSKLWASVAALTLGASAHAVPFIAGDIAVYRVGDGTATLANTGNAVFIDEYSPTGTLDGTIALPTTASGSNNALIASGTAGSEGLLNRSADGHSLILTGYSMTAGTNSLANTTSLAVPRTIGVVGFDGSINTATALTDFATANNPRSATSPDGNTLYVAGAAGGVRVTTVGSTTSTQLSTTQANIVDVNISNGNLFVSTTKGSSFRVGQVGTGLPTTSGQTITNVPGLPTSGGSPDQFFFADLSAAVAGPDTLYLADDGANTISKYSLVGGSFVLNGTIAASNVTGLTGSVNGSTVSIFGATGINGTNASVLYGAVDSSGYNAAPSVSNAAILATAPANEAFRGVALAPVAPTPEPGSISLLAAGGLALAARRKRAK